MKEAQGRPTLTCRRKSLILAKTLSSWKSCLLLSQDIHRIQLDTKIGRVVRDETFVALTFLVLSKSNDDAVFL